MYQRIVAFGCSNTYGHGLSDCNIDGRPGLSPSKFAWPALLDKPYLNLSNPGSSNKQIAMECLAQQFNETDVVVFAWTYAARNFYFNEKNETHQFHANQQQLHKKLSDDIDTLVAAVGWLRFLADRSWIDIIIEQYMYIKLADYHVKSFGAKVLHCRLDHCFEQFNKTQIPDNLYIPMHDIEETLMKTDPLSDGHAGPKGQQLTAKFIKRRLAKL
jgi:hypothetical protein